MMKPKLPQIPRRLARYDEKGEYPLHAESVYDPATNTPWFCVFNRETRAITFVADLAWTDGLTYKPYDGGHGGGPKSLLYKRAVRLPGRAEAYGTDEELDKEIEVFVRRYMHLPAERAYTITVAYIKLTWRGDNFPS